MIPGFFTSEKGSSGQRVAPLGESCRGAAGAGVSVGRREGNRRVAPGASLSLPLLLGEETKPDQTRECSRCGVKSPVTTCVEKCVLWC